MEQGNGLAAGGRVEDYGRGVHVHALEVNLGPAGPVIFHGVAAHQGGLEGEGRIDHEGDIDGENAGGVDDPAGNNLVRGAVPVPDGYFHAVGMGFEADHFGAGQELDAVVTRQGI